MSDPPTHTAPTEDPHVATAIEIAIRLGILFLLTALCLQILAPFAGIVAWALVIAIASDDLYSDLVDRLAGHRRSAAALLVATGFALLLVPSLLLSETLVAGAQHFAANLSSGEGVIPPPPSKVAGWPLIGERLYDAWLLASQNLEAALAKLRPQLEAVSRWLLHAAAAAGIALLQLAAAIVLAGVLLVRGEHRRSAIDRVMTRLIGTRGPEYAALGGATVKSVVQGILGVAVIQALLGGIAFMIAGVPGAGLWALLVLVAAVMQLPVLLVMLTPIFLVYNDSSTVVTVIFAVWCFGVAILDNVLKPILFGRGVEVPMIVIFLGAIGGMISMGIIGLFLGAVLLALGYELFLAWLGTPPPDAKATGAG